MNRDLYIWAKKYHLGQLDGKEYEELLAMLEEHPKSADAFYSALTILRGEELEVPPVDTEAALQRHLAREPSRSARRIQLISQNWWKIAAMFVPLLILIWFLRPATDNRPDYTTAQSELNKASRSLSSLVSQNEDKAAAPIRKGGKTYRAVKKAAVKAVAAKAAAIVTETETKLLRSASSGLRKTHYARIAQAVGSTKKILRS